MNKEHMAERKAFFLDLTEQIEDMRHRLNADGDLDDDYRNDMQGAVSLCQKRASIQIQAGTRNPGGLA